MLQRDLHAHSASHIIFPFSLNFSHTRKTLLLLLLLVNIKGSQPTKAKPNNKKKTMGITKTRVHLYNSRNTNRYIEKFHEVFVTSRQNLAKISAAKFASRNTWCQRINEESVINSLREKLDHCFTVRLHHHFLNTLTTSNGKSTTTQQIGHGSSFWVKAHTIEPNSSRRRPLLPTTTPGWGTEASQLGFRKLWGGFCQVIDLGIGFEVDTFPIIWSLLAASRIESTLLRVHLTVYWEELEDWLKMNSS